MSHQLQEAVKRGVPIVAFNPPRELGLTKFVNPQSPGRSADQARLSELTNDI
jgi:hypothetical protein